MATKLSFAVIAAVVFLAATAAAHPATTTRAPQPGHQYGPGNNPGAPKPPLGAPPNHQHQHPTEKPAKGTTAQHNHQHHHPTDKPIKVTTTQHNQQQHHPTDKPIKVPTTQHGHQHHHPTDKPAKGVTTQHTTTHIVHPTTPGPIGHHPAPHGSSTTKKPVQHSPQHPTTAKVPIHHGELPTLNPVQPTHRPVNPSAKPTTPHGTTIKPVPSYQPTTKKPGYH
ncbi:uncharacterized protein [Hetaerina americana]|uniref:uncharacterized protein n=1 Tax=Hetaerina americana TaxID=62018 RepID=UPI003A7F39F8